MLGQRESAQPERLPRRLLADVQRSLDIVARRVYGAAHGGEGPLSALHERISAWLRGEQRPSRAELRAVLAETKRVMVRAIDALPAPAYRSAVRGTVKAIGGFFDRKGARTR